MKYGAKKNRIKFYSLFVKTFGINAFIAVKAKYNDSVNNNLFYDMLDRRLMTQRIEDLAWFLNRELHHHYKEYSQYTN